ncbi:hypothetical protein SAMN05444007_104203 [Cribrihabitans marinus]|uniref:CAAX prenyl protease 2/Lysostaphin resistance protein A-like domain-containing protein n=1 Tax=Cribrihabitans marinus TaxID=1227549 RepID=A0A1H6XX25_9RHOB|nr:CPBP family intramembrane glutamic endopeptidase [Cribrihabitans marinus]GGH28181.1 abortive infection protein [Cribrihabitans marinus]SEJ33618.1 hypothetical protein SAMN05444007_104203 [Cribrihabitans marinus]
MSRHAYAAHERLVAPVRARPQLWRLLAGLGVMAAVVLAMNALVLIAIETAVPPGRRAAMLAGHSPQGMIILLASFGFVTLGVAVAVRLFQQRGLASVIGPAGPALRQFWRVARVLAGLALLLALLPPYDMGTPLLANLAPGLWLMLLPLSLGVVLIQVSAEEILFRGYVQQSLAARFRSPVIWMGLPAALFAMGHYLPAEAGANAGLIAVWSGAFGLLVSDITARAGTLGPAIAMHFFNNVVALLVVALPGQLDGLALFLLPYDMADTGPLRDWLLVDFALMLVAWLAARVALRR